MRVLDIADPFKKIIWNLLLIAAGSIICAMAVNGILVPREFMSSGFTGLAILFHYLIPAIPIGLLYLVLNIPLYILGWIYVGRRFFFYSIVGLFIYSIALILIEIPFPVHDQILSALLAGIIFGAGTGIILRSLGSAGGTDILSIILLKRFSIRLGNTVLAFNSVLLLGAAFLFSLETALYTLIFIYVNAHIINLVVMGLSQRKAILIISSHWKEICKEILQDMKRGVTVIRGEGGYSGAEEQILYTVTTFRELPRIKEMLNRIDPKAFVVVMNTLEVINQRIGNQPHW
jgi:uncharacterized membrane-anchored protein YitT (DUF2179 family)